MMRHLLAMLLLLPTLADSATYYVGKSGSDANSCTTATSSTAGSRKLTITSGLTCLAPGDTLIIGDGTYAQAVASVPDGSAGNYITIAAENEGNVIVTGDLAMAQDDQYLIFQGLRFHSANQKNIYGNHLKFFRTEFKNGPPPGNTVAVSIGTNNFTPGASYVLLEDCWAHGYGGRYKILVYNSDHVVLRRVVVRHDGSGASGIPNADITVYDSNFTEVQNSIAIDDLPNIPDYVAAFYNVCMGTAPTTCANRFLRGVMGIYPSNYTMGSEGVQTVNGLTVEDVVSVGAQYGISQMNASGATYRRLTILDSTQSGFYSSASIPVYDSIIAGSANKAYDGFSPTTSVAWGNGDNAGGTLLNPYTNGLLYPPRIESGSALASGGTYGQRGANIKTKIGTAGALYGDAGYNTDTGTLLWPWPNEARIKKEMCDDAGVTRGFCSSSSLTQYIMNYLGNGNPYGVISYAVTPSAGAGGTISPNTVQTINSGSTTSFAVTSNSGYTASVGGSCGGALVGTTYTTSAITGDCTVTATFADTQAPTTPADLDADSPSTSQVSLKWQPSTDNAGVSEYRIESCAGWNCSSYSQIGTSATPSYTHSGLTPGPTPTIYRYRVRAADAAGNLSGYAASIHFNPRPTIPAFPGAEGGGAVAMGGRGGTVYRVTSLSGGTGAGTLRECVNAGGPRTCVFAVAGNIELSGGGGVEAASPYLTIAGQTAPGDGITLSGKGSTANVLSVRTHNVIVRGIRARTGYNAATPSQAGDASNALSVAAVVGPVGPVIFDHVSNSWAQDETGSVWALSARPPKNITYSWCMIYEPLLAHPVNFLTGAQSSAVADGMTGLDLHHSLLANSSHRNPMIKNREFRMVNNAIYNWGDWAAGVYGTGQVDIIGNKFKAGPLYMTRSTKAYEIHSEPTGNSTTATTGTQSLYVVGNIGPHNADPLADNWGMTRLVDLEANAGVELGPLSASYRRFSPLAALPWPITASPIDLAEAAVLARTGASRRLDCAGNWVSMRDSADARIVSEYNAGTGIIPTTEADVGGYPTLAAGTACTDTDGDGMPDTWETANGLNPASAADGPTIHASGYSNLERYLAGNDDLTAPVLSGFGPASPLAANTTSTTLALTTDEPATCRYSSVGAEYIAMTTFPTTGGTSHSASVATAKGRTDWYYIRCQDASGNLSAQAVHHLSVADSPKRRGSH